MNERELWKLAREVLNPSQLEAFTMRHRAELTYQQMADVLGVTRQAARARVRSANERVRLAYLERKAA